MQRTGTRTSEGGGQRTLRCVAASLHHGQQPCARRPPGDKHRVWRGCHQDGLDEREGLVRRRGVWVRPHGGPRSPVQRSAHRLSMPRVSRGVRKPSTKRKLDSGAAVVLRNGRAHSTNCLVCGDAADGVRRRVKDQLARSLRFVVGGAGLAEPAVEEEPPTRRPRPSARRDVRDRVLEGGF